MECLKRFRRTIARHDDINPHHDIIHDVNISVPMSETAANRSTDAGSSLAWRRRIKFSNYSKYYIRVIFDAGTNLEVDTLNASVAIGANITEPVRFQLSTGMKAIRDTPETPRRNPTLFIPACKDGKPEIRRHFFTTHSKTVLVDIYYWCDEDGKWKFLRPNRSLLQRLHGTNYSVTDEMIEQVSKLDMSKK